MGEGLKHKYNLTKANGEEVDSNGQYFVLKLNSCNGKHGEASRKAALAYADAIESEIPKLAKDLRRVVALEERRINHPRCVRGLSDDDWDEDFFWWSCMYSGW